MFFKTLFAILPLVATVYATSIIPRQTTGPVTLRPQVGEYLCLTAKAENGQLTSGSETYLTGCREESDPEFKYQKWESKWKFKSTTYAYVMRTDNGNGGSNTLCLSRGEENGPNGSAVKLEQCDGTPEGRFAWEGGSTTFSHISIHDYDNYDSQTQSTKCLDVKEGDIQQCDDEYYATAQLWACAAKEAYNANQNWKTVPVTTTTTV